MMGEQAAKTKKTETSLPEGKIVQVSGPVVDVKFERGPLPEIRVHNAVVLEEVAKMAARCEMINPDVKEAPQCLQDKHYLRKHGPGAYYGQGNL